MEEIIKQLENIGLTSEEIQVYIRTLELGSATVLQIAQKVDIPRTTVYLLIDSLLAKGLLEQQEIGKKHFFNAASPEYLLKLAEQKKVSIDQTIHSLNSNLHQLQAIYNLKLEKPKIRYYEGIEGIQTIYEETLEQNHIFVHCMTQHAIQLLEDYLPKYYDRLIRKMIFTQEIVSDSQADKDYQHTYSTSRNEIVCIPQKYVTNTDYLIYGDTVAFITYKSGNPVGVVIEDKEIAHFERVRFLMIWNLVQKGCLEHQQENFTPIEENNLSLVKAT